jgi:hypothetical protein
MWRKVKFSLLFVAMIAVSIGPQTSTAGKRNEYRNVDYAYTVSLPADLHYDVNKPPNPNHGFRINVAPSATVWVDASYTDDSTLSQAVDSERAAWGKNCTAIGTETRELGGASATQITLKCAAESETASPTMVTLLLALGTPPDRGQIRYEIGMQYPLEAASGLQTQRAFKAALAGFHFMRP